MAKFFTPVATMTVEYSGARELSTVLTGAFEAQAIVLLNVLAANVFGGL